MAQDTVATVRIKAEVTSDNPTGYIVINESDKTDNQELFDVAPAKPSKPTAAEPPAPPAATTVAPAWAKP